jgi:hypothetical protein
MANIVDRPSELPVRDLLKEKKEREKFDIQKIINSIQGVDKTLSKVGETLVPTREDDTFGHYRKVESWSKADLEAGYKINEPETLQVTQKKKKDYGFDETLTYDPKNNFALKQWKNPDIADVKNKELFPFDPNKEVEREPYFNWLTDSLFDHPNWDSFSEGWFDENVAGILYNASLETDDPNTYISDLNYSYLDDPQLYNFMDNIEYFKNSTSAIRTKQLINKYFEELRHERNGPAYIIGRISGALTDPTSLLWFSPMGKYVFSGGRMLSAGKVMTAETIQETAKHIGNPDRTMTESAWMVGGAGVFPLVFGSGFKNTLSFADKKKFIEEMIADSEIKDITGAIINGNKVKFKTGRTHRWHNKETGETETISAKTIKTKFKLNKDGSLNYKNGKWKEKGATVELMKDGSFTITLNERILKNMWKNKTWQKTVIGDRKFKGKKLKNILTNYNKFKEFIINHELVHTYIRPNPTELKNWSKTGPKGELFIGRTLYEKRINNIALKHLSNKNNMWTHAKHFDVISNKQRFLEEIHLERFKPTPLSKIGEGSNWTPVTRIMNSNNLAAIKIMERLLHLPYIKMKNLFGIATEHSVEEMINLERFILADTMKEVLRQHSKFNKGNKWKDRITQHEFTKRVSRALIDDTYSDNAQVMAAAHKAREFYNHWAKRIQSSKIMEKRVEGEIEFLKSTAATMEYKTKVKTNHYRDILTKEEWQIWERGNYEYLKPYAQNIYKKAEIKINNEFNKLMKQKSKESASIRVKYDKEGIPIYKEYNIYQIQKKITELEDYLKAIKKNVRRKNYLNIFVKRDRILADEAGFDAFAKKSILKKYPDMTENEIFQILESFKGEQLFERASRKEVNLAAKLEDDYNMNIIMEPVGLSGHLKARKLDLDYNEWMKAGWIEDDVLALMQVYNRSVAPDIHLANIFGDQTIWGGHMSRSSGLNMGIKDVIYEYKIRYAKAKGNPKKQKALQREAEDIVRDLEAARDLLRGTYGIPDDATRVFSKAVRTFKNYNAITQLTGALAALPDLARMVMTSGFQRTLGGMLEQYSHRQWKTIMDMGMKEARLAGEGWDILLGTRAMAYADLDNIYGVFNKFERGLQKFTAWSFIFNLMSPWNQWVKAQAGINIGNRLIEESINWSKGTISAQNKMKLAASGIDERMANKIAKQYKKHGQGKDGYYNDLELKNLRLAQSEIWDDLEAAQAFRISLQRDINMTIVTPGKGDTPLWMSTEAGSLIAQYKKFGMGAFNRMLVRGLQENDASFYGGLLSLLLLGMAIDMVRHKAFDRDYSQTKLSERIINGIDRSGMLGIFMDVNNSIERVMNNKVGLRSMVGANRPYGTDSFDKVGAVLGPTVGQGEKLFNITTDWMSGNHNNHTARNVRRLIPLQNVFYLDGIFDSFEQGIK